MSVFWSKKFFLRMLSLQKKKKKKETRGCQKIKNTTASFSLIFTFKTVLRLFDKGKLDKRHFLFFYVSYSFK